MREDKTTREVVRPVADPEAPQILQTASGCGRNILRAGGWKGAIPPMSGYLTLCADYVACTAVRMDHRLNASYAKLTGGGVLLRSSRVPKLAFRGLSNRAPGFKADVILITGAIQRQETGNSAFDRLVRQLAVGWHEYYYLADVKLVTHRMPSDSRHKGQRSRLKKVQSLFRGFARL